MNLMPERGRLRRLLRVFASTAAATLLACALLLDLLYLRHAWHEGLTLERVGWRVDYRHLLSSIASRYPNLEWTLEKGELDLAKLNRETVNRIERSMTRAEAEQAMRDFVKAFGDRHLSLRSRKRPDYEQEMLKVDVLSRSTPPENACATLGYDGWRDDELPFDFKGLAALASLDDANAFGAGVLTLAGRRIGIVRVPSFDDDGYLSTCRDEWSRRRLTLETTCEEGCQTELRMAVRNRLIQHFESRIRQFRAAGVDLLVLDLTGNRGGFSWYRPLGRMVAAGRDLPSTPISLVRSPGAVGAIEAQMLRLDRGLALCRPHATQRSVVEEEYRRLDVARAEAMTPCNRRSVWWNGHARPICSQLTSLIDLPKDEIAHLDLPQTQGLADSLSAPVRYRQPRAVWSGRVAVLIDGGTGSAAELLAGILQDYGGATLIGQRTSGSGAGWNMGRWPEALANSRLELYIPDSVAYRRDGSSYRNGVTPDIQTGWKPGDDPASMAQRLVRALRMLSDRAVPLDQRRPA